MEMVAFGSWIKQRRKSLDYTQHHLAQRIGCSVETIRKIEANKLRPSRQIAECIAAQLDIPLPERARFIQFARAGRPSADWTLCPHADPGMVMEPARPPTVPPDYAAAAVTHLPRWPTPLIGRANELAHIRQHVLAEIRLLTVTGAPGIGKTRVAVQAATELAPAFAHGVCFVALAAIREPYLVHTAIAEALGVQSLTRQPLAEQLNAYLSDKHMLLVLDNFEHVLSAAPLVSALITAAPRLTVLVTSRARLRLYGEYELPIPPLALPDLQSLPAVEQLPTAYPSVALFTARVQAMRPHFRLTNDTAATVATICVRLDGLPLAIELAAARTKLFAPELLLELLEHRLAVLIGGPHDMPARQQTLRATLDWSYELLDANEQHLFRCLGVFAGGGTVEAAAALTAAGSQQQRDQQHLFANHRMLSLVERLAALVDQSLVRQVEQADGELRFVLLEMLREYALEQLERHGERATLQQRHTHYFLALAEQALPQLFTAEQADWLDRLEREHDNFRLALAWCREHSSAQGLRLATSLTEFWAMHGHFSEGRSWLEQFLGEPGVPPQLQAAGHACAGLLAYRQSDYAVAQTHYQASLALYRSHTSPPSETAMVYTGLGRLAFVRGEYAEAHQHFDAGMALCQAHNDQRGIARALSDLGALARNRGDFTTGTTQLQASLAIYRQLGYPWGIATALAALGTIAHLQGAAQQAQTYYTESLAIQRSLGDLWRSAHTLVNLGNLQLAAGDYASAHTQHTTSLALFQKLGDKSGIAQAHSCLGDLACAQGAFDQAHSCYTVALALAQTMQKPYPKLLWNLGFVAYRQHNHRQAAAWFRASLQMYQAAGNQAGIGLCLLGAARLAAAQGQPEQAVRLLGATEPLFGTSCTVFQGLERGNYLECIEALRVQVCAATFTRAWAAGRTAPLAAIIAEAFPATEAREYGR